MKVVITNKASYAREVQYFRKNQFVVLNPRESMNIEDVHDAIEIAYYETLRSHGFDVCFHHESQQSVCGDLCTDDTCLDDEVGVQKSDSTEEGQEDSGASDCPSTGSTPDLDLSEFSDDDLKRIVQNLGIEAPRVRARWKLERYVVENLPRDASPKDYL